MIIFDTYYTTPCCLVSDSLEYPRPKPEHFPCFSRVI